MPVSEKHSARSVTVSENPSARTIWRVWDVADESAASSLLIPQLPANYLFPNDKVGYLTSMEMREVFEGQEYEATVTYNTSEPKQQNSFDYEFEIGSQSVTVTTSLGTTAYTGGGRTAPNFNGGININADGEVQGLSIDVPTFSFSVTGYWPKDVIDRSYQLLMADLSSSVNDRPFFGLPTGSVKFLGGRGNVNKDKFNITYRFEHVYNEAGLTVGDITGINKEGFQYLDVYRRKIESNGKVAEVPHSVYIHDIYPKKNFDLLKIGLQSEN